jgi:hypothetical protein
MTSSEPTDVKRPSPSAPADPLIPVGAWIRLDVPDHPCVVGFTYVDQEAGFSAQGWKVAGSALDQSSRIILRLPMPGVPWHRLGPDEVQALGLESPPSWVAEFYGPQPAAGSLWGVWRDHPKLKGRFLPDYPDDLQVLVHDGGPRITRNPAEAVWVRVTGMDGDVFRGRLLNQPHNLQSVRQGSEITFVVAEGAKLPVMVTDKYLTQRREWIIHPCRRCGFSELFDAPSDLIRVVFPHTPPDAQMSMFTALCPLCGGVQGVQSRTTLVPGGKEAAPPPASGKRPWWRFWG